jgi:hypothetical protein
MRFLLVIAAGCTGAPVDPTCADVRADVEAELVEVRSCADDLACGQVIHGTSCGCTRDLVARTDADLDRLQALLAVGADQSCDLGMTTVCDCPETAGFRCDAGTCTWNYVADWPYLPQCWADRGDSFSIEAAALDGSDLVVTVGYGGGCAPHDFTLCWPDQAFLESYPVQASLELFHDGHGDSCDAWFVEDRRFSLAPLVDAFGAPAGTIVVRIGEFELPFTFGGR